jgi:hypothetical protein
MYERQTSRLRHKRLQIHFSFLSFFRGRLENGPHTQRNIAAVRVTAVLPTVRRFGGLYCRQVKRGAVAWDDRGLLARRQRFRRRLRAPAIPLRLGWEGKHTTTHTDAGLGQGRGCDLGRLELPRNGRPARAVWAFNAPPRHTTLPGNTQGTQLADGGYRIRDMVAQSFVCRVPSALAALTTRMISACGRTRCHTNSKNTTKNHD